MRVAVNKISNYIDKGLGGTKNGTNSKIETDYDAHRKFAERTKWLTIIVGSFEALAFYSVTIYLIRIGGQSHPIETLLPIIFGWFALKAIGNFGSWSNPTYGRAIFYRFLLGTLLNITLSIGLAYTTTWLTGVKSVW